MLKLPRLGTKAHAKLVARYKRAWLRACAAEEAAETLALAWRLGAASERALRALRAVEAGKSPLPAPRRTPGNLAKGAALALARVGAAIARAFQAKAALAKAQAANAARRAAKRARRAAREALRVVARLALSATPARLAPVTPALGGLWAVAPTVLASPWAALWAATPKEIYVSLQ